MWIDIAPIEQVKKQKKVVVTQGDDFNILVVFHDDKCFAMNNICIHRQRELVEGVILRGRLVCPGHQWAFDLRTGWEAIKEQGLPVYDTRIIDGMVQVDLTSLRVANSA